MLNLLQKFSAYIEAHKLSGRNDHWLLAVSGGLDSVVLCHLCRAAGYDFSIAHANFNLRGAESERDEESVRRLAAQLGVPIHVQLFNTEAYASANKVSIQEAARNLRYAWFTELIDERAFPIQHIATGHHQDDNVETVLMNFLKGTGISGLTGMAPRRDRIIRPLLFATKVELLEYAGTVGISWVDDSSNASADYTRNFLRLRVLPLLAEVYPSVTDRIAGGIDVWKDTEQLFQQAVDRHKKNLLVRDGEEILIPVRKLQQVSPLATITYEILKEYGFTPGQAGEALKLLQSESGSYVQSRSHRVLRNRAWLIISPLRSGAQQVLVIAEGEKVKVFDENELHLSLLETVGDPPPGDRSTAYLDAAHLHYPLLLRRWRAGDYFYPLGMRKKKKLARFFIDAKLSLLQKENTWVLESNKHIVWVLGQRIDDRYKITPATRQVLRLAISPRKSRSPR